MAKPEGSRVAEYRLRPVGGEPTSAAFDIFEGPDAAAAYDRAIAMFAEDFDATAIGVWDVDRLIFTVTRP